MQIPIAQPSLGSEESEAVLAVLASGMIAQGPVTAAFEEEFAAYCGVPHAVAVSNGTTALHAALLAAGVKPGDEVISYGRPLSVLLGPGLIASIYDGIQRPLVGISEACGSYIRKGIKLSPLDTQKKWDFRPLVKAGVVPDHHVMGFRVALGDLPEEHQREAEVH